MTRLCGCNPDIHEFLSRKTVLEIADWIYVIQDRLCEHGNEHLGSITDIIFLD
jgi:hypothetical protein